MDETVQQTVGRRTGMHDTHVRYITKGIRAKQMLFNNKYLIDFYIEREIVFSCLLLRFHFINNFNHFARIFPSFVSFARSFIFNVFI